MSDLDLSIIGAPPPHLPSANIFDFIFSNPLQKRGPVARHAPNQEAQNHVISKVPPHKPLLVDPQSGRSIFD